MKPAPGGKQPPAPIAEVPSPEKPKDQQPESPSKALRIPDKLRDIKTLNLATDTLALVLTEQLTVAKTKLSLAESEVITLKSRLSTSDSQLSKLKREADSLTD